ncbi:hypothetical protein MRB53_040167 [Persea americana]|nr:hypothetical protein MRB53_040167 [Persea americana]
MSSTFDVNESRLRKVEAPATTPDPLHPLFERTMKEGRQSAAFGKCKLPAGKAVTFSDYPAVAEYSLPQYKEASSYFVVSRRSINADGSCVAGTIYSTSTLAGVSAAQGGATYAMSASGKGVPYVNSDHVYELRILGDFFSYALEQSDAPTCDDFNTAYVNDGKLQSLFDLTPNVNHPNFAAIDQHVNLKKGNYYSMGTERVNPNDGYQKYITKLSDNLQNFALVAGLMNEQAMVTQFQVVHQRIWNQLTVWDQLDATCGDVVKIKWADTYSKWMKEYLSERNNFYTNAASTWYDLFSSTSSVVAENNEKNKGKAGYKPTVLPVYSHLTKSYPPDKFSIPIDKMVSLAPAPEKRAVTSPAACSLSLSLSTKGSAKPTSLSTQSTPGAKPTSISTKASSSQISKPVSASSKVITSPLSTRTSTRPPPPSSTVKSPPPSSSSKQTPVTSSTPPPVTSSTPPPPPKTSSTISLTPMVTNPPVCHDAGSEPGHNDVHDYEVHNIAVAYCGNPDYASANSTGPWLQLNMFLADGTDYRVEAAWIPGCNQQNMNPSVMLPLGDGQIDCVDIFMQTYTGCNNGGIGGYMNVGCMRYDLVAGLGPKSDMPANDGWIVVEDENPSNDGGRPEQLEEAENDDGFPFF